jgi:catechol-2,3-dioxygenase
MIARIQTVVIDAPDIVGLAAFYRDLAGWTEMPEEDEDDWIELRTQDGYRIAFQLAPDHVPPQWPDQAHPQQFHLDLRVPDIDAAAETAEKLGATRLGGGETWHTLADPAGHPFDLCLNADDPATTIYGVTLDCPDPRALGKFYANLLGMEIRYEADFGVLIGADDQGQLMFQKVEGYNPPQWPDPAHPQQFHLDLHVSDIDEAEPKVLEAGATRLPGGGQTFRVYADPAGHPFCLCF